MGVLLPNLCGHPLKEDRWEKQRGITLVLSVCSLWHALLKINRLTIL